MPTSKNHKAKESNLKFVLIPLEDIFRRIVFIHIAHFADQAVRRFPRHSTSTDLELVQQDVRFHLWELICQYINFSTCLQEDVIQIIDREMKRSQRKDTRNRELIEDLKTLHLGYAASPMEDLERDEIVCAVETQLQSFSAQQERALRKLNGLGTFDQIPLQQVAEDENVTRQTVRNWRTRAYSQLRLNKNIQSLVS
jgi:DNA-directed RNA polymerase sigma subunit (sigma70/sigma32)